MYDLTSRLELTSTWEDNRGLDALAHARRHKHLRDYNPERHEGGRPVDISFATLNWQKAIRDKNRPGASLDIAEIVRQLQEEGHVINRGDLARISPYLTEHIRRFGEYAPHELGLEPEAYEPHLDVDFSPLRGDDSRALDGYGQAA